MSTSHEPTIGTAPAGRAQAAAAAITAAAEHDGARLLALAYSLLHDRDQARDTVQDTMERAYRARSSLRDPARCSAWLSTICVREARRRLRRQRLLRVVPFLPTDATTAPDEGVDVDLERALRRLSIRQRTVVALHYGHGYSLDECAAVMRCRPGTARRHLHRALQTLRQELTP